MTRILTTMPREAFDFFIPSKVLRAGDGLNTIYAMHWDGTYRDRVLNTKYSPEYWTEEDVADNNPPAPADRLAKHLA